MHVQTHMYHMSSGHATTLQHVGLHDTGWSYNGKNTVLLAAAFFHYTINLMTDSQNVTCQQSVVICRDQGYV